MKANAFSPESYDSLLEEKATFIRQKFTYFNLPSVEVYSSEPAYYRMRAEFRLWHEGEHIHYAMFEPNCKSKPYYIKNFPIASQRINELMPELIDRFNDNKVLAGRLFQIEFLTTQTNEALISLIYHRPLSDEWITEAKRIESELSIAVIGRSRKQKCTLSKEYVTETLTVNNKPWYYQQYENSFTQPNAGVNEKMLAWVQGVAKNISQNKKNDFIELYCGNGNFTCVLAPHFNQGLATEISKTSVKSANYNFELNKVENVTVARMSSEEFTQALNNERVFRRLNSVDLNAYQFSTIFVDPPRAGLDPKILRLVQRFDHIIYISCNPETLYKNLQALHQSHTVNRFALFDQFPYTAHIECGVYLEKGSKIKISQSQS